MLERLFKRRKVLYNSDDNFAPRIKPDPGPYTNTQTISYDRYEMY